MHVVLNPGGDIVLQDKGSGQEHNVKDEAHKDEAHKGLKGHHISLPNRCACPGATVVCGYESDGKSLVVAGIGRASKIYV